MALLTPIGGWSYGHKPLRVNLDSVDDRPGRTVIIGRRRETGEIADNDAHLCFPRELRAGIITEVHKGHEEQILSFDGSLETHMAPFSRRRNSFCIRAVTQEALYPCKFIFCEINIELSFFFNSYIFIRDISICFFLHIEFVCKMCFIYSVINII